MFLQSRFGWKVIWWGIVLVCLLTQPVKIQASVPETEYPSYNIIYAYTDAEGSSSDRLAHMFKEYVEEASGGDVAVELFSQGSLGGSAELASGVKDGVVQIISGDMVEVHDEIYSIFEIPRLFENLEAARTAMDHEGELWRAIQEASEERHIKLLTAVPLGFRLLSANRRVEAPQDLQGLKMRVMVGDIPNKFWSLLGAAPVPMDINNLCTALQTGAVEAEENPVYIQYTMNMYKQQKYVVETNHKMFFFTLLMNREYFYDLPEEYQQIILDAADLLNDSAYDAFITNEEDSRRKMMEYGIEFITPSQELTDEMDRYAEQTWDMVRERAGDELVDIALQAAGKIPAE